ncbi:MAG: VCBS repeat-containing protein, partial [Candidatus Cloacimonetes bacterium]|nr:VCBS repeat-containing protein [Candidatus Cloacimonadota bacterium]
MQSTTDYIDDLNPGYEGMLGSGRLNAYQAAMYDLIPSLFISDYHFYEVEGDGDGLPNPGELCNVELMVQNNWFAQGFWAEAHDVTVTIATDNPEITIIAGTETYEISYIGPLGSHWNYSNPIQITTPETSSLYNLEFTVTITANQDSQFPYEVVHDFMIQLTLLQDGWPYDVSGTSTSSGIIVDIDNDNIKEIIFGDQNGYLHVVNNYGTPFGNFPYDFGGNISSAVAVGNINGDDYKEIVFNNEDGFIHAIDYLGDLVFAYDAGGIFKGNPIIADVDGNGSMEIIAVTFTGNKAIVLNSDGSDYPNFPVTLSCGGTLSSPAVGDLDGDGIMEIIAASLSGAIYAISTATGENLANWPYSIGTNSWKGPIVANFDGDPDPEVMVAAATGDLVVIEHDGTLKFSREIDGQIKTCPVIGDIDGNRSVECVIINSDGDVYVIDGNGNDLGIFPVSIGAAVESSPILADMDNNGTMDIVFGDFLGYLHVLDYTGNETANYPYYIGSTIKVGPALADADGDGDPEIIIPNQSAYALVDHKFNVAASQIAWSCFKRNPCRTGNGFDPTTGTSGDIIPALVTNLGRNYPNPFNPSTNIAFSLEKDSYVNLEIFNIKGQSVKVLLAEQVQRGAHFIEWDGRDEQNHPVGSGIYLYRLQTGDYQSARKMMMIK